MRPGPPRVERAAGARPSLRPASALGGALTLAAVIGLGAYGYSQFTRRPPRSSRCRTVRTSLRLRCPTTLATPPSCSESVCAGATYFIRNARIRSGRAGVGSCESQGVTDCRARLTRRLEHSGDSTRCHHFVRGRKSGVLTSDVSVASVAHLPALQEFSHDRGRPVTFNGITPYRWPAAFRPGRSRPAKAPPSRRHWSPTVLVRRSDRRGADTRWQIYVADRKDDPLGRGAARGRLASAP